MEPAVAPSRDAAERPEANGGGGLQGLLVRAVRSLAREASVERVLAWGRDARGAPTVLAAEIEGSALHTPNAVALAALATLEGVRDLGAPPFAADLRVLAEVHGVSAAVPLGDVDAPVAYLLTGGEPAGFVRPRTLAALAAAAQTLRGPAASDAALRRLAGLDREVQRLDRLAALGGLVAEIVHEIRNPLVSVKTFLQLLPEREGDEEFDHEFLAVATDELRRIERLLDVVLQHARPGTSSALDPPAEVPVVLDSVARLLSFRAADRSIRIELDASNTLPRPTIAGDALRQIVLNLTLNALEATPAGSAVRLSARADATHVIIDVEDEGPGVPDELRERLFEPFFSTKGERAGGLGLAITRRLAEEAGGALSAQRRPSGGSCFQVRLPRQP